VKKEYVPLILIVGFIIIQILFYTFAETLIPPYLANGEMSGMWFMFSAFVFLILGIYAIIKGSRLRRSEETKKIGTITLLIGILVIIFPLYFMFILSSPVQNQFGVGEIVSL